MSSAMRLQGRQSASVELSSRLSAGPASIREIRPHEAGELETLLELCAEHAEYELAPFSSDGQAERWRGALENGDVQVFFAHHDGETFGFAAMSLEYSTWRAEQYAHLDCLYVRSSARGRGLGKALMKTIEQRARQLECRQIQWQTPPWNEKALAFYGSLGATSQPKLRFCLPLDRR